MKRKGLRPHLHGLKGKVLVEISPWPACMCGLLLGAGCARDRHWL